MLTEVIFMLSDSEPSSALYNVPLGSNSFYTAKVHHICLYRVVRQGALQLNEKSEHQLMKLTTHDSYF